MSDRGAGNLRYVIIGAAGAVAQKHVRALGSLAARVVGMCDVDETRGADAAQASACLFGRDYGAILRELRPDVAVICTPHPTHAPIATACLQLGIHALVEKPVAIDVSDAEELASFSERCGALVGVNMGERFRPSVERARDMVARGELGRVLRVSLLQTWRRDPGYYSGSSWRGSWRGEGGGVLMNQAPHTLDTLCHLLGSPVTVRALTRTLRHDIECEDTAQALLDYRDGALGWVALSTAELHTQRRFEVVGERAALVLADDVLSIRRMPEAGSVSASVPGDTRREELLERDDRELDTYAAVHQDFQRAILAHRRPRCDARDAIPALELANAMLLSGASERSVALPLDRAAYSAYLRARQRT